MIPEDIFYMQFLKKDKEKHPYRYTNEYVECLIILEIKNNIFSKSEILKILNSTYGEGHIRITKVEQYCKKMFFIIMKNVYELTEKQKAFKKYMDEILYEIKLNNKEDDLLISNVEKENIIKYGKMKLYDFVEFEKFKINLFLYYFEKDSIKEKISSKMNNINSDILSSDISFFVEDKLVNQIFLINNIETINDIKNLEIDKFLAIFFFDTEKIYSLLNNLRLSIKDIVNEFSQLLFSKLDEVEVKLLKERLIIGKATLEDIGKYFGVTRERIRQKESKLKNKLLNNELRKISKFIMQYIFSLEAKPYVQIRKINFIINDSTIMNSIIYIVNEDSNSNYVYESIYQIVYNSTLASIESIINDNIARYNEVIKIDEYNRANCIQKKYIDLNYRMINNIAYIKKGYSNSIILRNEIVEKFSQGIKINKENYEILKRNIITKYGSEGIFPNNLHSLMATIERIGFTLKDRGTYIANEFSAKIPDSLYGKILLFVEKYGIAPFSSLYQKFKKELAFVGIDNQYYLKGCLDNRLEEENKMSNLNNKLSELNNSIISANRFRTDRDAIYYNESKYDSISEIILTKMRSYESDFSIKEIEEELHSFKNFNFTNIIFKEQQNGLIRFNFDTYIYLNKLNIDYKFIEMMNQTLKENLYNNEIHAISMNKFYIKMKLKYGEILKQYKIDNSNKLFSVAEHFCKNFYFNRPMISSDENYYQSQYSIICNYIKSLDKFSFDDVKEFIRNQRFNNLWNFSELLIEMSSDFVQVSVNSMISIKKFEISKEELSEIDRMISFLLNNGNINTKTFKGYSLFPKLKYIWNKYLLIGIIRTFLSEKYEIENTENHYDKTEYIVRSV